MSEYSNIRNIALFVLVLSSFSTNLRAQEAEIPALTAAGFSALAQVPGADMNKRFGLNGAAKFNIYHLCPSGFTFGLTIGNIFGQTVKEDVLANLKNSDGEIVAINGLYSFVKLRETGFTAQANIGKLFNGIGHNPLSGIFIEIGAGLTQHRIDVDDFDELLPQVLEDYAKGYDRLSNGFSLHQFIAYQLMSDNHLVNFRIGLDFTQAFTQNRRDHDFVIRAKLDESRVDLLTGLRFEWIIPFYGKNKTYQNF